VVQGAWHWQQTSFFAKTLDKAAKSPVHPMPEPDLRAAITYANKTLANPDQRVPSDLAAILSADLAALMRGAMRELFGTSLNVALEMTHYGAAIVMALPLKEFGEAGLLG
jgi:hypothetical protein